MKTDGSFVNQYLQRITYNPKVYYAQSKETFKESSFIHSKIYQETPKFPIFYTK